jgi:hypothetical protein
VTWRATLVLLVAVGGCSGARPGVVAPPASTTEVRQAPVAAKDDPNAKRVAAALGKVESFRKLRAKHAVPSRTMDRAPLIAQVEAHSKDETPPDAVRGQGELLVAFGLVPPMYDVEKGVFKLLEQQLAGYYEPADKTMYLAADLGEDDAEATLAHELVHALQDQHYDLGPQLHYQPDGGDRTAAVHALAEGDAMSAMMDFMMASSGKTALDIPEEALATQMRAQAMLSGAASDIPMVLQTSLVAPYVDGMMFVSALRRRGGWAEVDRAWKRPPVTSEQLLHLDKYDAKEPPLAVPAPPLDALGGGFSVLFTDLFGEESMRLTFEEWGRRKAAESLSAGWGGDRASLLVRTHDGVEERLATWVIRYDADACGKAKQAFSFVAKGAVKTGTVAERSTQVCRDRTDLGPIAVTWGGCDLWMVAGPFTRKTEGKPEARGTCAEIGPWMASLVKPG